MKKTTRTTRKLPTSRLYRKVMFALLFSLSAFVNQKSNAQCTASFAFIMDSMNVGNMLFMDNSSTNIGAIDSHFWDFGDGTIDSIANPSHFFSAPGVYTVCETIGTDSGCVDSFCVAITITPQNPSITVDMFGADSSGTIFCTAPATTDFILSGVADGFSISDSVEVYIVYGDGTDTTFNLTIPQRYFFSMWNHTYLNAGTYIPTVIVSNASYADTMTATPIVVNSNCGPLSGTVYLDNNGDCIFNSGDQTLANIQISLSAAGIVIAWTQTDSNGVYSFNVPSGNTYDITVQLNNWYGGSYSSICPSSGSIVSASVPSSGNDFYVGCPAGFDLTGSTSVWGIVPGRIGSVCVFAYDRFCNSPSGQIKVILDPLLTAIPDSGSSYTISGDTIIWNYNSAATYWSYCAQVLTSSTAMLGDTVCLTTIIEPIAGDNNPADNIFTNCTAVRTSYDPNDKTGEPFGQGINHAILPGTEITYTIRFQNTGTAEAYDVYILDSLDQNLDLNTYQMVASSHPMVASILQDNVLRFTFNNIMLPDSNSNEPASHGYVTYRISPRAGTADGTVISNTAGIYFDFNPAVKTNTTTHTIDYTLGLKSISKKGGIQLIPNPSQDRLLIHVENKGMYQFQLINMLGESVYMVKSDLEQVPVNTATLPPGIYLVRAENGTQVYQGRLVITH